MKLSHIIPALLVSTSCSKPSVSHATDYQNLIYGIDKNPNTLPYTWLTRQFTKGEIESEAPPSLAKFPIDLNQGSQSKTWAQAKAELVTGDELWAWESDKSSLPWFAYGYAIRRNGTIVAAKVAVISFLKAPC